MRKIDLISEVYRETLRDVTKDIPSWKSFLHTAAFQYKYPFDDQVLIHAQRPDATACAEIELWNKQFGRWVNKGAKGIALIAEGHGHQYLRYVFDVADTHHRDNVPFDIWHNKPEQEGEIITALENRYGELPEKSTLENSMMFACMNAVVDNTPDYLENLKQSVVGSRLENVSEKDLAGKLNVLLTANVVYMVAVRLGLDADKLLGNNIFQGITEFNTPETLCCLGYATSDIAEMILRDVEKTVKSFDRSKKEIRTFDASSERGYNDGEKIKTEQGGNQYGNDLQGTERGSDSEPDLTDRGETDARQVRSDASEISEGASEGDLRTTSRGSETGETPVRDRADGEVTDRGDGEPDGTDAGSERADETDEPDEVGSDDEQLQDLGGGNSDRGTDLRIKTELPGCDSEVMIQALRHGDYLAKSKEEVVSFLRSETNDERKDEYVRALYTEGLFAEFYKTGTKEHIGYHATPAGLTVYDGNYLTRKAESGFSWSLTRELIEALIADKNYLDTPLEKASAQISLFDEPAGKEEKPLHNAAGQFAVSQEVIDAFLRLGGATKGSSQRIYCFYRRANDPKENIEFLKREYGRDAIGLLLGGRKAAAAWDENGVRIAEGESVSDAKDSILLSWEAVDKRIRELLESGQYLSDFEAETAENEWNKYVGGKLSNLYWDYFENISEEYKKCSPTRRAGFPEIEKTLLSYLESPEKLEILIREIKDNIERMAEYPPHFKYNFTTDEVLSLAETYRRDPVDFPKADASLLPPEHFVSQDKIDADLAHYGSNIAESKFRIYSYFLQENDPQKRASFMSKEYGVGGHYTDRWDVTYDGKGLMIGGGLDKMRSGILLSWAQVVKRIDALIRDDRFLTPKEIDNLEAYEKKQVVSKIFGFYLNKDESIPKPFSCSAFSRTEKDEQELAERISDPDELREIIDRMQSAFDMEMPGSRQYDYDKECLKTVKDFADGTFDLFPGSPFLDREPPERKEEPTWQETEPQEVTEASEPEAEPIPEYDIHLGTDVYIGQTECSVISLDGDTVELFDGTLIPLEMDKATFYKRVAENPFNDHLKKAVEVAPEKTETEAKTIAMTRIGDFYEFFGEDAKTASEVLDLMLTSRMMADGKRVPMCGIPYHVQDRYVKQLTDAGYKVEIHEVLNPEKPKVVEATYNELEEAKRLISDFCKAEYGAEADFSDLEKIGVAYTETPDEGYPIQVNVNLKEYSVVRYLDGKCFDREQYASLKELTEKVLRFLDFGELTDVSDEVLEKYNAETESQPSDEPVFRTDDHIFIDTDRKEVSWIYYNPDADAGGQFVWSRLSFTVFKEAYDDFVQNGGDFEDKAQRDAFIDSISEMADCELADERTPYIAEARAAFEAEPDLLEFTPEHIKKIADDIENYYAELEAVRAGDAYEAEFGADGTRAFPGNASGQSVFDRELDILDSILYRLKIDDMELDYKDGTLVATDPENTWTGREFYEFLVNEAFVFTDEGGVLGISDHLLSDFKELSESYGVPLGDNRTIGMPNLAEAPKEKPVRPTFDSFAGVPMDKRHNFKIEDEGIGVGTPSERYQHNVDAIRLLKEIESENRIATPEEQKILSQYVGWGGLAECFDEKSTHYAELKSLLTEEEYTAARESTLTAFFTPPVVIDAIYQALKSWGFKRGNILEPSCGVGNFMGRLPDSMSESKFYGVELDSISGRIARQLYQKASITVDGFEKTQFPDSFFDVAIGNVPFGQFKVPDKKYDKQGFLIHDYFFAKALDKVRPGGIVAFITSRGTLDKESPAVRQYIANRAELLGAIRLPNNTFKDAAGTEVTSDIIFLQKYDRVIEANPDWVHLGKDDDGIPMNSYFVNDPEMIMGEMQMKSGPFGPEPTCVPYDGISLKEQLQNAVANIHTEIKEREEDEPAGEEDNSIPADPTVRNFSYTLVDGKIYYRQNSVMTLVDTTATGENRIKGMIALRDIVRELIDAQLYDASDAEIKSLQARLNRQYDDFTKKYGLINSRANASVFSDDNTYFLLCSLEILDDNKELLAKADMFSKRTINPQKTVDHVDTASEALALSIGERAAVDMEYMSSLTGKSEEELFSDLKGVVFLNPLYGYGNPHEPKYLMADEYLSGNVREKLAVARRTAELYPDDYKVNVEALERVQPQDLNATEIGVRLGSTWIPDEYVQQFMYELLGTPFYLKYRVQVKFIPQTAQWVISEKTLDRGNVKANSVYGTSRINAYHIIEETLNLRDVRINDYVEDANGNKKPVLNKKETAIAQGKQDQIKRAFEEWIWKDPTRRETLVKLYNEKFNSIRPREYDGSHIKFYGMSPEITLRKHQSDAVARILYGGNSLLAHVVGAGKTYTMVAAAQESKRLGLCHKSMFVVPNHLIEQWASEYLQLYPSANILVANKKDFETKNRKKFCARIATGDYDAIIIGHSQFEKIPVSVERQIETLQGEINEILESIDQLKYERGERLTVKQLEKTRKSLQARLDKLNDQSRKDDVVTFEQLGVDRLFIDEAHFYKNLFMYTKMRNVAGIAQTEAQKSSDLYMKCRYLDELTDGKGVVFATGTPISNSMVELYTMQRYLQYDELKRQGLSQFDAWASTYGETVTAIELSPDGSGYRAKTRFAKFFNIPELMAMFKQTADVQTADMLNLPVPKANYYVEKVAATDIQKDLVQSFAKRAERVHNRMVSSSEDNMLLITNDGRKAALDQRLIDPSLPDDEASKVNACVRNVYEIWERTEEKKSAQMIFCDLSTPKGDGKFNVYDDIRTKLIERGIPAEEIAFIHNADTDAKKKELFSKVRSGQVRVLLGSTFKMGAGTNVQKRLVALHDLDCPWRPSDLEQRAGRIVRQGNENPEVDITRYITEGTFDAYSYQLLESKQKFISQIMTSKSPVRVAEDVDETALSYAEIKALASGNPKIMEKMQLDADVAKLKLQKASHLSQRYALEDKLIKEFPKEIAEAEERIAGYEADMQTAVESTHPNPDEKNFSPMVLFGQEYTVKADAGKAILEICKKITNPDPRPLGEYRGFKMDLGFDQMAKEFYIVLKGKLSHRVPLGQDAGGIITRLDNAIESMSVKKKNCEDRLTELHKQVENAKAEAEAPFPDEELLQEKSKRLDELNAELNLDKAENEIADDDPEQEETSENKEIARTEEDRDER